METYKKIPEETAKAVESRDLWKTDRGRETWQRGPVFFITHILVPVPFDF